MKKFLLLALTLAILTATGCERRRDYLVPQTENKVWKATCEAANVLFPLGTTANIIVSEMMLDAQGQTATN
ncbi:hypothetical protein FACS1894139_17470 [Planctomycetales bacterium]|nr:hypothetical protein FACS1894108_12960 [Planctomycetales bacterium]GHT08150.1 hypothetical protein FACS1894139_17470 [Planctomycetales bacterium]